ncbi:unnamed protein product [Effrenium voratum]|uniref:Uncharacterized protein n=1 Tax=Effrenium voratum TaxID=2562239 RepID=A0AA36HVZ7_9DINO|nr:unnamed protein product [Effrenium voratum]CAJ1447060.1 unnamed protein product [Effrenium voratum]
MGAACVHQAPEPEKDDALALTEEPGSDVADLTPLSGESEETSQELSASPSVSKPNHAFGDADNVLGLIKNRKGSEKEMDIPEILRDIARTLKAEDMSTAKDISKPTAKVLYKAKTKPARDCVEISLRSEEQVPYIPLLEMKEERIQSGIIPTIWAVPHWPLWFPFCESNTEVKRFSPSCWIMHVKLKVLFFCVDFLLFASVDDLLESEGRITVSMRSPPPGSEGEQWMGVTVPPRLGALPRVCLHNAFLDCKPTGHGKFDVNLRLELEDPAGAPQWVKTFVFQQMAIRILPDLCKFQGKIPGSALDHFLNNKNCSPEVAAGVQYIKDLGASLDAYNAPAEARRLPDPKDAKCSL